MNKAIQDCEANITRLTDDLHVIDEAIRNAQTAGELQRQTNYKATTTTARDGEYDKLRRLQSEQAIAEAQQ